MATIKDILKSKKKPKEIVELLRLSNNYLNHIRIAFVHIKSDSSCIQHFDSPT